MRTLSATLLAAQKEATRTPYVKVEAKNKIAGVVRLDWTRLYTGAEADYFHAVAMPGDGSLIRARITPPGDSRKLYRQRVTSPGPASDFSQWVYTSQYSVLAVAACSLNAEVSIFWIDLSYKLQRFKSTDNGATWGSAELIDTTPSTSIYGLAAAYKPNGDLALFFADQATLYVKKLIGGNWQAKAAWDKTTSDLSGVACVYDGDRDLVVSGQDTVGSWKVWSLVYGDGGAVAAGSWSALKELASAPAGGNFEYRNVFLDKPDVHRAFYVEKFTGTEAYNRPFWSHTVLDTSFLGSQWREPVPFNLSSEYGLAMAHHGDYCWLSSPSGVWRAPLAVQSLDLSADVIRVREDLAEESGRLGVELNNDSGKYASPGTGAISVLNMGCQLEFSPGYRTTAGNEVSAGQSFLLAAYEHTSAGGKATLILRAVDGWAALKMWRARHQFRWNKSTSEMSVKQILEFILARAGLKLEVKSQSAVITGYYPDFTIHPGDSGGEVVRKLLAFVPDVIFMEGAQAYLVNPQASDSSVYSYGTGHAIREGRYGKGAWAPNRIQVEGYDTGAATPIIVDSFA